jgi:UDP:flavonoid glycosyltransferase YjiC (YdhE family)
MRILFTTNPLYGHLYPMLPLMNAARRADHEVIVATGANFAPEVERHGFAIWSVGPSAQQVRAQSATTDDDPPMDQLGQMVEAGMRLFGRPGIARARDLTPLAADWQPDLVVHELTEAAGWQAAAGSGAVDVMHGFGTHIPYLVDAMQIVLGAVRSELGRSDRSRDLPPDARTPQTIRAAIEEVLDNPSYAAGARVLQADIAGMPSANEVLTRVVALAR